MTRCRVLHVDDDEPTLRTVARVLEAAGFSVVSTTSPFIAPIIKKEQPDVIVMDVDMPLLSGDRIVSIIRGNDYSTIPVVFFSSAGTRELAGFAERTQPASFVRKDQGISTLIERIGTITAR